MTTVAQLRRAQQAEREGMTYTDTFGGQRARERRVHRLLRKRLRRITDPNTRAVLLGQTEYDG